MNINVITSLNFVFILLLSTWNVQVLAAHGIAKYTVTWCKKGKGKIKICYCSDFTKKEKKMKAAIIWKWKYEILPRMHISQLDWLRSRFHEFRETAWIISHLNSVHRSFARSSYGAPCMVKTKNIWMPLISWLCWNLLCWRLGKIFLKVMNSVLINMWNETKISRIIELKGGNTRQNRV